MNNNFHVYTEPAIIVYSQSHLSLYVPSFLFNIVRDGNIRKCVFQVNISSAPNRMGVCRHTPF